MEQPAYKYKPSVRGGASVIVAAATLAVVAAGCGGSSSEEKWADSVCSSVSDWESQVRQSSDDVMEKLQSPAPGMLAAIDADVRESVDATDELAADLKALDPPDTESGTQAKQKLDALTSQLERTAKQAKQTVASVPEDAGAVETARTLLPLASALQSLAVSTSSTLAAVQASGKEIKQGFQDADACKPFR